MYDIDKQQILTMSRAQSVLPSLDPGHLPPMANPADPPFPTSAYIEDSFGRDHQVRSLFLREGSLRSDLPPLEFVFRHDYSISIRPAIRSPIDALTESSHS